MSIFSDISYPTAMHSDPPKVQFCTTREERMRQWYELVSISRNFGDLEELVYKKTRFGKTQFISGTQSQHLERLVYEITRLTSV